MAAASQKRPNRLLRSLILISCIIHIFVFGHVAGLYNSSAMSYIELSLQQFSKPDVRNVPSPRFRQKKHDITRVKTLKVLHHRVSKPKLEKIKARQMDHGYETITLPDLPDSIDSGSFSVPALQAEDVSGIATGGGNLEFTSVRDYFEMLNLRIHSVKRYPESARSRHIEGRVKVEFTLQKDGTPTQIRIVKSSRHKNLDDAAIEAIQKASPFPRPPLHILKTPAVLQVNLLFELA